MIKNMSVTTVKIMGINAMTQIPKLLIFSGSYCINLALSASSCTFLPTILVFCIALIIFSLTCQPKAL
jgi:hypothetical protein